MSKLTLTLAAAAFTLFAAAQTFAQDATPAPTPGTTANHGANFVDKDGDGICDNFGTANQGAGKGQGKGQGKGCQGAAGCGKGYVDANNDGVCDNQANRQGGKGQGKGGQGQGKGSCKNR